MPSRSPEHRRFLLLGGVWALSILAMSVFSYRRFFVQPGGVLTDPNAMDFAQIGRNMATGHGYGTSILRPLAVTGFAGPDSQGVAPDVSRAPLYPFVLMLATLAHGGHLGDNTIVHVSLILFLCSVFGVYRLARTFFPAPEQAGIALLSAGLYGIGGQGLGYAVAGLPVTLATLMLTLLLIALHRAFEMPGRPAGASSALVVGLLLGLCYLAQYSLLLLAVPALVYLFFSRAPDRAWAGVGACALGFFVITGAWLVRNAHLGHGNPFFTLLFYSIMNHSAEYPGGTTIYRVAAPSVGPLAYSYSHLPDMLARLGSGLTFYRDHLLEAFNVFLLAAAASSLLWSFPDARLNALRGYAAFCLLAIILVTALFDPTAQIIAPFAPLITVVAVGFVFRVVAEQNWDPLLQRTAVWSVGLLVGLGSLIQFAGAKPPPLDPISGGIGQLSDSHLSANQAVISDAPWEVAWRTGLPAVWLPADNQAYGAVAFRAAQSRIAIQAMLLTPDLANYDLTTADNEAAAWLALEKNPSASDQHARNQRRLQEYVADLVKRHDPRVAGLTPEQIQQEMAASLSKMEPDYNALGPISDMVAAFQPTATVPEASGFNSILFLRR